MKTKLIILWIYFQDNRLVGKSILFAASGDRIEFEYDDGYVQGKAVVSGANGDKVRELWLR